MNKDLSEKQTELENEKSNIVNNYKLEIEEHNKTNQSLVEELGKDQVGVSGKKRIG